MLEPPRWLPTHPQGQGPLRRPRLTREWSAPAILERVEQAAQDSYESFPGHLRARSTLRQRVSHAVRQALDDQVERAEATAFRAAVRMAFCWVCCCLCRHKRRD